MGHNHQSRQQVRLRRLKRTMGQSASKATTEAAKRSAPRLSQAVQTQSTRSAAEAEWRRSSAAAAASSSGSASAIMGSTSGSSRSNANNINSSRSIIPEDEAFSTVPEMPPDLLQFLQDVGPLERTVDRELTSARVYDTLMKDEKAREEQAREANQRVRRKMPIMSGVAEGDDGTMTERTTNFSTRERSSDSTSSVGNSRSLGLTREDLFRLMEKMKGLEVDGPEWKRELEQEYYKGMAENAKKKPKNFDQLKDVALFENSLKYIGVPVLMKDMDGDIIGTWRHKSEDMQHSLSLKVVRERSVQFVMLNEGEYANES
mmetsp:Transcript_39062/g.66605  ORF Transcript_39062/g.66605 Transcript_39062/m.66605 type:complete len:317 (+) Transcript_39062:42-992(+)